MIETATPLASIEDFRALARARLELEPPDIVKTPDRTFRIGDHALDRLPPDAATVAAGRPAAVLVPIMQRVDGLTVILTKRSSQLRSHSGQVAFPGGKIDAGETPRDAALREAYEEVGMSPQPWRRSAGSTFI